MNYNVIISYLTLIVAFSSILLGIIMMLFYILLGRCIRCSCEPYCSIFITLFGLGLIILPWYLIARSQNIEREEYEELQLVRVSVMFNYTLLYALSIVSFLFLLFIFYIINKSIPKKYRRGFLPIDNDQKAKIKYTCRRGKNSRYY